MAGRIKGKKDIAEKAPRGRVTQVEPLTMSLEQVEERLMRSVLSGTLALHVLRNTRKPVSLLAKELMEIEMEVGQFVGAAMQMHAETLKASKLRGTLAGALSFIPIPTTGLGLRSTTQPKPKPLINQPTRIKKKANPNKARKSHARR